MAQFKYTDLLLQKFFGSLFPKVDDPEKAGRHRDPNHPSAKHRRPDLFRSSVAVTPPHTVGGPRRRDRRPKMVRDQAARRQMTRQTRRLRED